MLSSAQNYVACGGIGGSAESVAIATATVETLLVRTFSRFAGSPMIIDSIAELNINCYLQKGIGHGENCKRKVSNYFIEELKSNRRGL